MSNSSEALKMRVAVVGAGLGSAPHFKSLQDLAPDVEVAWVYARNADRLATAEVPGRRTSCFEDILEDASVEAVLVLTPPNTHLGIVERLARAGKHVLVEKPLEIDLAKAEALVQACEDHEVKLAVMLQHRMRDAALSLASHVQHGTLGELVSARASVRWWRPQSYYDEPGRGTLARDGGGVLMTQAIHTLDLLLSLTGLPDKITGLAWTSPVHRMECEDTASALLHYANGAIGTVDATTAAYPGFAETIELNGSLGTASLGGGELHIRLLDGQVLHAGQPETSGAGASIMGFDHGPHRTVIHDFLDAVRTGREPRVSGQSALGVHRVIDAIMTSSRNGGPVALSATPVIPVM